MERLGRIRSIAVAVLLVAGALVWLWGSLYQPATAQQGFPDYGPNRSQFDRLAQPYAVAQNTNPRQQPNAEKPVLKPYVCRPGEAPAFGARLKETFAKQPGVRIVVDERTSQVLVIAPPQTHARIAQLLGQPRPPADRPGPQLPASRWVQLERVDARYLEATLAGMLGGRLAPLPDSRPGEADYRVDLADGGQVKLSVDHRNNRATVEGSGPAVDSCLRLIQAIDSPQATPSRSTRLVSLKNASPQSVRRAVQAIRSGTPGPQANGQMVTMLMQPPAEQPPAGEAAEEEPAAAAPNGGAAQPAGLIGPVQIELLEGLDVLVIRGNRRDVDRVMEIIDQIEQLSVETEPAVNVHALQHVDCRALAEMIVPLYEEIFTPRQGSVSITALVKPNALLLIGREQSVATVVDLVKQLDRPVAPHGEFRVFRLRHAAAATAKTMVDEFYAERGGLGTRILVTADVRSNALIVRAAPRDMAELAALVERVDTPTSAAVNEIRVFKLENSLAEDLAPILQEAITGQAGRRPGAAAGAAATGRQAEQKSAMLRFLTLDAKGRKQIESGILSDVRITADVRANALIVSAPAGNMELLEALIRQLDQLPAAQAQIKVFTIVNGDAPAMAEMLQTLFGSQAGADQPVLQTAAGEGESSLVQLRFAVDVRTNSIIASGSMGDLQVVEAILLRLDESDVRQRESMVYRLKNAPALDVANAINEFLRSERQLQQVTPGLLSAFEQIEREVIVVPEPVSNSLIVSATPRFFNEVKKLVEEIDQRPPMVMIQVLIAEVALNDTDEFGVELGLQDSILFNRSLLGDITTLTTSRDLQTVNGIVTETTEAIASATYTPGFAFNNQPLGASSGAGSSNLVGNQGITSFSVGRLNNELGFGGLVFSASSESVSVLVRALKECRRLDVLSRPQIMTLDNQPAFVQVGKRVPTIRGTQINEAGQVNNIEYENVGLIMGVTPRISPEGLVVMEIDVEKSQVGPIEEGIPIYITPTSEVIRAPMFDTTTAQTTVSALDGQTVVLGGLITKHKSDVHRKVPFLGDIPVVRNLFRYDATVYKRTELLIIMTPHVVRTEADIEAIKQVEAARMSWCLCDVMKLADDPGLRGRSDEWLDSETQVIYPDLDPDGRAVVVPEEVPRGAEGGPVPAEEPFVPEILHEPAVGPTPAQQPEGTRLKLRLPDQAARPVDGWPGRVEPAIYRGPEPARAGPHGVSNGVVPSTYHQAPQGQPMPYRQDVRMPAYGDANLY